MPDHPRSLLAAFLAPGCGERLFRHAAPHPAEPTGFCFCDHGLFGTLKVVLRATIFQVVCAFPFNRLTCAVLRLGGVRIGQGVYISAGAWFDPMFPHLITIEDGVFIGSGARLHSHEFRPAEFRAGRTLLRRGCFIGGYALIACGVEVGEGATVAAATVLGRDVPAGMTAIGNPARIVQGKP